MGKRRSGVEPWSIYWWQIDVAGSRSATREQKGGNIGAYFNGSVSAVMMAHERVSEQGGIPGLVLLQAHTRDTVPVGAEHTSGSRAVVVRQCEYAFSHFHPIPPPFPPAGCVRVFPG